MEERVQLLADAPHLLSCRFKALSVELDLPSDLVDGVLLVHEVIPHDVGAEALVHPRLAHRVFGRSLLLFDRFGAFLVDTPFVCELTQRFIALRDV